MRKILCAMLGLLFAVPSFANCNLLPVYNTSPVTEHGVTFTPQPDGSIIINGSVNDGSEYANYIVARATNNLVLPAGTYTISGTTGGSSSTYILDLYGGYTSGNATSDFFDTRAGDPIKRTATSEWRLGMYAIRIMRGYTANNLVVRPMIERGTTVTAYTPYDANCVERCANLYNYNYRKPSDFEFVDGNTLRNTSTTNNTRFQLSIYDAINQEMAASKVFTTPGNYNVKFNVVRDNNSMSMYHSGSNGNLSFLIPQKINPGEYILSFDLLSANPSVVGGLQLKNISLRPAYCSEIQVATTKYTETVFNPLNTALQNAISVVDSVVTQTITQAASIATLQSGKQTRPADNAECPAYKQCLLVEDESGTPHWYQITDPFRDFVTPIVANNVNAASSTSTPGYTQLEYIESTETQWIDTGVYLSSNHAVEFVANGVGDFFGTRSPTSNASFGVTGRNVLDMYASGPEIYAGGRLSVENMDTNTNYIYHIESGNKWVKNADNGTVLGRSTYVPNAFTISEYTAPIFSIAWGGSAADWANKSKGKLYSFKIWNNGTLVRNFVPVIDNATGKVGMYDTVGQRFYGNAASSGDDFTPGPIVDNDADVPGMTWSATWAADATTGVSAGTIIGEGLCNAVVSSQGSVATSEQLSASGWSQNGANCWCRVSGVEINGEYTALQSVIWVFRPLGSGVACSASCANYCGAYVRDSATVRPTLFGM